MDEERLAAGGPTRRDWLLESSGHIICFRSSTDRCTVTGVTDGGEGGPNVLLKANRATPYHDEELMGVTEEINGLLQGVVERNRDRPEQLALLRSSRGMFLAWVTCDAIGPDDAEALEEQLGI